MIDARVERAKELDHPRRPLDLALGRGPTAPQKHSFASPSGGGGLEEAAQQAGVCEKTVARRRARPACRIAPYRAAAGSRPPDRRCENPTNGGNSSQLYNSKVGSGLRFRLPDAKTPQMEAIRVNSTIPTKARSCMAGTAPQTETRTDTDTFVPAPPPA